MEFSGINGIEIQERDLALLRGLLDSRVMTIAHAATLHFDGHAEAAKKRTHKLKVAGLIRERKRKPYEPSVMTLSASGYDLLRREGRLTGIPSLSRRTLERRMRVSDLTLRHELEVMDVKAAIAAAIRGDPTLSIAEHSTWPSLCQFTASPAGLGPEVLVKPDSFVRIHEEAPNGSYEHVFFIELDRGTETLGTLGRRALCYLDYYRRGGLAERFGRDRSEYKDFPFRVLMIFPSAERRNNMAERLLSGHPPIYTQVWLSTLREVIADARGPIWVRPRDCGECLNVTVFGMRRLSGSGAFQCNAAVDDLVQSRVPKLRLLHSAE